MSDLARDVDISQPTAKAWLSVLEASWQVVLLQPSPSSGFVAHTVQVRHHSGNRKVRSSSCAGSPLWTNTR